MWLGLPELNDPTTTDPCSSKYIRLSSVIFLLYSFHIPPLDHTIIPDQQERLTHLRCLQSASLRHSSPWRCCCYLPIRLQLLELVTSAVSPRSRVSTVSSETVLLCLMLRTFVGRHGDIEDTLLTLLMSRAAGGKKFDKMSVARVYFGNWLRDYCM